MRRTSLQEESEDTRYEHDVRGGGRWTGKLMVVFNFALCSQANLVPFDNLRARNSSRLSYRVAERYQCAVSRVLTVWQTHRALDAAEGETDGLRGSKGMPFDESAGSGRRYRVGARNDSGEDAHRVPVLRRLLDEVVDGLRGGIRAGGL